LGEDNHYVLGQILGLSTQEIDQLRQAGVIGETLEEASTPSFVPLARQVELGWIVEYDPEYQQPSSFV
jgi:hypothetical protein